MQTSSPYNENYIKKYSNANFFENVTKNEWIQQVLNPESDFYILVKEEVQQLFFKTGCFVPLHASFDGLYALSVQDTIRQFSENLIRKKIWLFGVCTDNNLIFKKIKQRLVNNTRNLFDSKRRTNILTLRTGLEYIHKEREIVYSDINTDIDDVLTIINTQPDIFKKYLKNIYYDLDYADFNYLLSLSKYKAVDILGYDPVEKYSIRINASTSQMYIDFSETAR
ncbi:MAG: hypothetical protein GQ474_08915 [Sulfurimonas sp.]|nr:hypothetical protein [Sulfurimonas sp.]